MKWRISSALLARIRNEAEAARPAEICGLLVGRPGEIEEIVPSPNLASDPGRGFELDTSMQLVVQRRARNAGRTILGHYHSHPSGRADPSPADRSRMGAKGCLWLILAGEEAALWGEGDRAFTRLILDIVDALPCNHDGDGPIGR